MHSGVSRGGAGISSFQKEKKDFFAYSKGRISYADGIKYHVATYGAYDFASVGIMTLLLAILFALAGESFIVRAFPVLFTMLNALGVVGLLVAALLIGAAMIMGIFFSQKKWRAEYFMNE